MILEQRLSDSETQIIKADYILVIYTCKLLFLIKDAA